MKKIYLLILSLVLISAAQAQLTGTKNIPGDYADLAAAITDLNTQGVGAGGLTLNVIAGNPQTSPTALGTIGGGYVIGGTGSLVLTTTSAANPVIIQGNGNTITAPTGASPAGHVVGQLNDAIIKLVGADWITITGFTLRENPGNTVTAAATNTMTEFGIALFYASATDGSQNNTIQNNTISLSRLYQNSFGIYSNVRHTTTSITVSAEVATSAAGSNSFNKVYTNAINNVNYGIVFVGAVTTLAAIDNGNDIGGSSAATGNTLTNWGVLGTAISGYISVSGANSGIIMHQQINDNISYNTITSFAGAASGVMVAITLNGITKTYAATPTGTITSNITNNTITVTSAPTTGFCQAISSTGLLALATSTLNINNNNIINCAITGAAATTGAIVGITNSSIFGTLNINNNIISGSTRTGTTGQVQGISNSGAVVNTININNNQFGTAAADYVNILTASSGAVFGINTSAGAATCITTIQNNDIRRIVHAVAGSSAHTYITSTGLVLTNNINNNTFTNLNVNTTGSVTFVNHGYTMPANGTQTFNNNSIVTAFNKAGAGGTITGFTSGSSSPNSATHTITNNNLSNITVTGATAITGITNSDGSGTSANRTVTGNVFSNWTGGTSAIIGMNYLYIGATSTISNNTLTNFTGTNSITGINIGSTFNGGNPLLMNNNTINNFTSSGAGGTVVGIISSNTSPIVNISANTINRLSTTGATANGINITGATLTNVFKNNIYDIISSNTTPTVNGIVLGGGTLTNAYNNFVSDLRAPNANAAVPIYGINVSGGTTVGLYYNTIVLGKAATLTSTGAQFGVTGIGYSSTTNHTLRNNIVWIDATPVGTGAIAAVRRTAAGTAGTAPSAANFNSNNNIYYVLTATGISPVVANLNKYLYLEGNVTTTATNGYGVEIGQVDNVTLNLKNDANFNTACGLYKTFMGSRETATFTENNLTAGAGNTFAPFGSSFAAENAQVITTPSITDDYSSIVRSATTPDIGALEFAGIGVDAAAPSITFTALTNTVCTSAPTLTAVITDASGINTTAGLAPRLYYRKGAATAEADVFLNYPAENTNAFNGWKYVEATGTAPNFSFAINYSLLTSPMVLGDSLTYFVVAQDNAAIPNVGKNAVTFPTTFCPTSVVIPSTGAVPTSASLGFKIIPYLPTYTNSTAGNYQQGTVNAPKMYINVAGFNPCLDNVNSVTFNTGTSTAPATDITQAKCFYTTTTTFNTTTPYGTAIAGPSGAMTFTGTQALAAGTGNYFWLVYDVSCAAVVLDSINATATNIVIGSTPFVPTGTSYSRHAVSVLYAPTYTNTTAGNYQQGTANATKAYINISGSTACADPVNSVTFNTGTSTAPAADITQAKCYYTTTSTFGTTTPYGMAISTPSGAMTFTGTQALANGTGNYFWLVYDVNCGAIVADSINATVTNIVVGSNTFVPTGTGYSRHAVSAPVLGDNIVIAPTAALGLAAVNPYITLGKTLESGEPSPILNSQGGGGTGQANYSWGTAAGSTAWYKLVVPTSGYGSSGNFGIWADTSVGSNADNQIAIWEFPSMPSGCGNAPNFTGAKLLQANDDRIVTAGTDFIATGELVGNGFNAAIRTRLTPGNTYYIQIDGFSTNTPFGNLYIEDLAQAPYNIPNNGLGNYHNPTAVDMRYAAYEVNGTDGWTYYYENNGTIGTVTDDKVLMAVNWGAGFLYNGTYAPGTTMANHVKGTARNLTAPSAGNALVSSDSIVVWSGRLNAAATSNDLALTDGGYVLSPNWWMMNKFWNLIPRNQPSAAVGVRTYYSDADFTALQTAVVAGGGTLAAHSNMQFIKATKAGGLHFSNAEVDPGAGHAALTLGTVTSLTWTNTDGVEAGADPINQAQYSVSTFSGGGGGSTGAGSVLPYYADKLNGSKQGNINLLDWNVSCVGSPFIDITLERSADGRNFTALQQQNATYARCEQRFNYTDASPLVGANYYRVKIVTPEGKVRYTTIVVILNKEKGFELISLAPNPAIGKATLTLTSAKAGKIEIVVRDITGKNVSGKSITVIAGNNPIDMNFATLGAGTYSITAINAEGELKTIRFVKY